MTMKRLLAKKELTITLMLIVIMVVISIVNPVFLRLDNFMDILRSNCVLGILACGMLLVILTGGIDVSVGAVISASSCIVGTFLISVTGNIFLAIVVGVLSGAVMGLVNGLLIAKLGIAPIVITLGTLSIINGIVKYTTNGTWITNLPDNFIQFGQISFFGVPVEGVNKLVGIPIQVIFLVAIVFITWLLLKYTMFGRSVYAIGGNRVSAERIGYNVKKTEILIYTYLGALAGIASVVHTSIYRQVDPNSFTGYEIQVIAAVVIGGASSTGGYGSVLGVMLGCALMSVLNNGLILMRIPTFWQKIVFGLIILLAVSFEAINKQRIEKKSVRVDVE